MGQPQGRCLAPRSNARVADTQRAEPRSHNASAGTCTAPPSHEKTRRRHRGGPRTTTTQDSLERSASAAENKYEVTIHRKNLEATLRIKLGREDDIIANRAAGVATLKKLFKAYMQGGDLVR